MRKLFLLCWLGGIFAGVSANLFTVMLPQAIRTLAPDADLQMVSYLGSVIVSLFLMGWMLGGIAIGGLSDRYGRVKAMCLSVALYSTFTFLGAFCTTPWQLAVCRFFTGIGVGGELVTISIMIAESIPNRSRAMGIGALIASYQVGVFLSGFFGNLLTDWRTAFIVGGLPILLALYIYFFLEESKKWKEAINQRVNLEWNNIAIGSITFGAFLVAYWASAAWVPTWIQQLIGTGQGNEQHYITMAHGLSAILGCLLAGYLADKAGRRHALMFACLGAFCLSTIMFLGHTNFHMMIYMEHALLGMFIGLGQAVLYIYLPELFPTSVRGQSVGICLNLGRVVTAIAVLMIGVFMSMFGSYAIALTVFASFYLISAIGAYCGPETSGRTL